LFEQHLGAPVAEVGEHDDDQLVPFVVGLVGNPAARRLAVAAGCVERVFDRSRSGRSRAGFSRRPASAGLLYPAVIVPNRP
jgi:hypothetical protein